jgi:integrase
MVKRAEENDKVDYHCLKAFRMTRKLLKPGDNARDRILSIEEYVNLLSAVPAHLKEILTVAYNTGMRKGELLGLRWDQIDRKHRIITLAATETKERNAKKVPINHHVQAVLDGMIPVIRDGARVPFVFLFNGKPIGDNIRKSLVTACRKIGIDYGQHIQGGFRFHDIRTSVKTNMLRAGVDPAMRNILSGHAVQGMAKYYLMPSEGDLHRAMNQYTEWLDNEIKQVEKCPLLTKKQNVNQNVNQMGS